MHLRQQHREWESPGEEFWPQPVLGTSDWQSHDQQLFLERVRWEETAIADMNSSKLNLMQYMALWGWSYDGSGAEHCLIELYLLCQHNEKVLYTLALKLMYGPPEHRLTVESRMLCAPGNAWKRSEPDLWLPQGS